MTSKVDALTVVCPSCAAVIGDRCWSGTRRGRKLSRGSHPDRVRAARGEHVPQSFQTYLKDELRRVTAETIGTFNKRK